MIGIRIMRFLIPRRLRDDLVARSKLTGSAFRSRTITLNFGLFVIEIGATLEHREEREDER